MNGEGRRKWITIGLAVAFLATWIVLFFLVPPRELVERVGSSAR